jgi:hypothetical protein
VKGLEELKNHFDQLVQRKLEEIKESSFTYGAARDAVYELYMRSKNSFESAFAKEVEKRLLGEMNQLEISLREEKAAAATTAIKSCVSCNKEYSPLFKFCPVCGQCLVDSESIAAQVDGYHLL